MKKLLLTIGLALSVASGFSQDWQGPSLLASGIKALGTGTNTTGGASQTNLFLAYTNAGMVHATNFIYTNSSGTVVRPAAATTTNTSNTLPLFNVVPLYVDRQGQPIVNTVSGIVPGAVNIAGSSSNFLAISSQSLVAELINPLGSNGNVGIVIAPVWKNNTVTPDRNNDWPVLIPGGLGARVMLVTNVPTWKWPGAYGITVRYITNDFGGTASAATMVTNAPFISRLDVVGFHP